MPEPSHLPPLDAEEQTLYSEPLPDDRASHPISKGEPRHPAEEAHFGRVLVYSVTQKDLGPHVKRLAWISY